MVIEFVMSWRYGSVVINCGEKLAEGTPENIAKDPDVLQAYLIKE